GPAALVNGEPGEAQAHGHPKISSCKSVTCAQPVVRGPAVPRSPTIRPGERSPSIRPGELTVCEPGSGWLAVGEGVDLEFGGFDGEPDLAAGAERELCYRRGG